MTTVLFTIFAFCGLTKFDVPTIIFGIMILGMFDIITFNVGRYEGKQDEKYRRSRFQRLTQNSEATSGRFVTK
jgi:hypothetical protein